MMDFIKNNKMSVVGAVAVAAVVWAYFTFFNSSSAPLTASTPDSAISGDLLATLNSLHTIKLDNSIFSDPLFLSLADYGTPLPQQDSGRRNPFAPVGRGASASSTPARP